MTDGASNVIPAPVALHPCSRIYKVRIHSVSIVFVSLAAICVGCQSISDADRSLVLSSDSPSPAVPAGEPDGEKNSESGQSGESDTDPSVDESDPPPRPFLGFPIGKLLDDSPEDQDDDPPERRPPSRPDMREPGPDTANFPNSPYTLPQGRAYVEASPASISAPTPATPP